MSNPVVLLMRSFTGYLALFVACTILFSSCMIVFNKKKHNVTIGTNRESDKIFVDNEPFFLEDGETELKVERSKGPLTIKPDPTDSARKVTINSRNSFNYLYDVICTAGLSTLVYKKNPKRYFYQKNIYLEQKADTILVRRFAPVKKGTINLTLSFPYANSIYTRKITGHRHKFGFLGYVPGIEYFYRTNTSLFLQAGVAIDNGVPVPAAVHYYGQYEKAGTLFFNFRHNHVIRSFDVGYGLSYSWFRWYETHTTDPSFVYKQKDTRGLGLSFASQYRITKNFRVGLLYQPTILNLEKGIHSDYQHLLSLELILKFRVRK
jgi:hypothetical protein